MLAYNAQFYPACQTGTLLLLSSTDVDDEDMCQKLILRVQHLIQLEELLRLTLSYAPASVALPMCQGAITPFVQVKARF